MKKDKIVGIVVCMLLMVGTVFSVAGITNNETGYCPVSNNSDEWITYLGNFERTGYTKGLAPQTKEIKWVFETEPLAMSYSTVIADNKVYICDDEHAYCLDIDTGEVIWSYTTEYFDGSIFTIDGDKAYVASSNYMYCFDADAGTTIWSYCKEEFRYYAGSPVVSNDKVYFALDRGNYGINATLICLDADTGKMIWENPMGYYSLSEPMLAYGNIYVKSEEALGRMIYCFNATTGSLVWSLHIGLTFGTVSAFDGKIYASDISTIYCLNAFNGSQIWKYAIKNGTAYSSISIGYNNAYFSVQNGIYCLDAESGNEKWYHEVNTSLFGCGIPVIGDYKVYVMTQGDYIPSVNSELLCLDSNTGETLWKYVDDGGYLSSTPAIAYGYLFSVNPMQDKLYCFADSSKAPSDPEIGGKKKGLYGKEYKILVMSTDPDNDNIRYQVDWGDGEVSDWSSYQQSGKHKAFSHIWDNVGAYDIRVIAEDVYGIKSHWSKHKIDIVDEPLLKIKSLSEGLFKVKAVITNSGTKDAVGVNWSIILDGDLVLLGKETTGVDDIPINDELTITSKLIFGFGSAVITVNATVPIGFSDIREQKAFVFLFFILMK